jgi:hypothetical protein
MLAMLLNKYIGPALEFNLKNILNILLAYKGPQAYAVGEQIAQLVRRYA